MITKKNDLKKALEACGTTADATAFVGEMPKGKYHVVGFDDVTTWEDSESGRSGKWLPVNLKSEKDGSIFQMSAIGLVTAKGLAFNTRNLHERVAKVFELIGTDNDDFEFIKSETRTGIRKRDTASGKAGTEYTVKERYFKPKTIE